METTMGKHANRDKEEIIMNVWEQWEYFYDERHYGIEDGMLIELFIEGDKITAVRARRA